MAYNPQMPFNLKPATLKTHKFTPEQVAQSEYKYSIENIFQMLKDFNSRKVSGDAARLAYLNFIETQDDAAIELLNRLLEKDLKAGISSKSINKAFPKLIPEMMYMCCSLVDKITNIKPWINGDYVLSQEKLDGMFANININEDSIEIVSRSGSTFPLESGIFDNVVNQALTTLQKFHQYHGEMLIKDKSNQEYLPREISNGILNSVLKDAKSFNSEQHEVVVVLWDKVSYNLLTEEKQEKSSYNQKYINRFNELKKELSSLNENQAIVLVETRQYPTLLEAQEHFEEMINSGKEGTIVKLPDMLWKNGTSKDQVKLKVEFVVELQPIKFLPGTGKNENYFGAITCVSADNKLSVDLPVSGFTDKQKDEIMLNPKEFLENILSVKANSIMYPTGNKEQASLFLPRFVEVRNDKNEADSFEKIIEQFNMSISLQKQIEKTVKAKDK